MVSNTADRAPARAGAQAAGARRCRRAHARSRDARRSCRATCVVLSAGDMIPADCRVLSAHGPVRRPGGDDRRVAAGGEVRATAPRAPAARRSSSATSSSWAPTSSPARPRRWCWPPAPRTYFGTLAARATATDTRAERLPGRRQQRELAADPLRRGDGADRAAASTASPRATGCEAFLFALSVAVGLTPEMLPMIVTTTLAKGAVLLSRKKVVVKRLDAIQNFGAMDVLCTDKTGTLTQDQIALARHTDAFGAALRRGAELRLPQQPLPDRAEEPARPRRARARGAARPS